MHGFVTKIGVKCNLCMYVLLTVIVKLNYEIIHNAWMNNIRNTGNKVHDRNIN